MHTDMTPIFCFAMPPGHRLEHAIVFSRADSDGKPLFNLWAKWKAVQGGYHVPVASIEEAHAYVTPKFFRCGGCDHLHRLGWVGDCRVDEQRYTDRRLEHEFGKEGTDWLEVHEQTGEHVGLYSEGVYDEEEL